MNSITPHLKQVWKKNFSPVMKYCDSWGIHDALAEFVGNVKAKLCVFSRPINGTKPSHFEKDGFKDKKVAKKMKAGGSPMRIMSRAEVQTMWKERQAYLTDLLKDLKK